MSDFRLGEHSEAIRSLQLDVTDIKETVLRIELSLAEKKGERRVALWAAGVAGTAAAALVSLGVELVKWLRHA
jgi:hypothetical protein